MLGWNITLRRLTDAESVRRALAVAASDPGETPQLDEAALGDRLAVWQAGPAGLGWIREAARRPGGVEVPRGGYPNWYLLYAADVLPVLFARRSYEAPMYEYPTWIVSEGDVLLPGWLGKTTIDERAVGCCGPDEWLLAMAWDES